MNPETALQQNALAEVGASATHRLWRNATGTYHAGKVVARGPKKVTLRPGDVVLRGGTTVHAGLCVGSSDLVGIVSVPVRILPPDGVVGLFAGIELKVPGNGAKPHQRKWLDVIRDLGGVAGVAHSAEEIMDILRRGR